MYMSAGTAVDLLREGVGTAGNSATAIGTSLQLLADGRGDFPRHSGVSGFGSLIAR
tara:strand:+ start:278 stop:445 length:168 start_codon:yes stop_codon:yes gene_type:complete